MESICRAIKRTRQIDSILRGTAPSAAARAGLPYGVGEPIPLGAGVLEGLGLGVGDGDGVGVGVVTAVWVGRGVLGCVDAVVVAVVDGLIDGVGLEDGGACRGAVRGSSLRSARAALMMRAARSWEIKPSLSATRASSISPISVARTTAY